MKPLSGEEVAQIISKVYNLLDPEFACKLVHPNIVLSIAGMKYYANIAWIHYKKELDNQLVTVNAILKEHGIKIRIRKDTATLAIGFLVNLKGAEYTSAHSSLPWVEKYIYTSDETGFVTWYRTTKDNLDKYQTQGTISKECNLEILFQGVYMGYPDTAILDFEEACRHHNLEQLTHINLSYPSIYETTSAVPNFDYYPHHKNSKDICRWKRDANKVLTEFYNSKWYKDLVINPEFIGITAVANEFAKKRRKQLYDKVIKGTLPKKYRL